MTDLSNLISTTLATQDVKIATDISKMSPSELQTYLQTQHDNVYNTIIQAKQDTFSKVYGDLTNAGTVEESVLMYHNRSKELRDIRDQVYNNQKEDAVMLTGDKDLAKRKNEMNEWSIGNKNDTLFVFSILFITLCFSILLALLSRLGFISNYVWWLSSIIIIIIITVLIIYRYTYTTSLRNKRYWDKKNFSGNYGKQPVAQCQP
jgi:uncharacterized membrane protein